VSCSRKRQQSSAQGHPHPTPSPLPSSPLALLRVVFSFLVCCVASADVVVVSGVATPLVVSSVATPSLCPQSSTLPASLRQEPRGLPEGMRLVYTHVCVCVRAHMYA